MDVNLVLTKTETALVTKHARSNERMHDTLRDHDSLLRDCGHLELRYFRMQIGALALLSRRIEALLYA